MTSGLSRDFFPILVIAARNQKKLFQSPNGVAVNRERFELVASTSGSTFYVTG